MNIKVKIFLASIMAFFIISISNNVYAASASLRAQKTNLEPGESTSIIASVSATEAWNLKVTASGGNLSGTTVNADSAGSEVSKDVISATFTASEEGTYTITLSGQVTGSDLVKQEVTGKTVTINVKKPTPVEPETPTTPEQETPTIPSTPEEPETPAVEEKPNFTNTNKTMYASKAINLRASWSTESLATSIEEGTELTVTATSSNKVNGYVWYQVSYNGKTLYVASNLLTDTKPEKTEQPTEEEPKETEEPTTTVEEPQTVDTDKNETDETKDGLQSLQIEGVTLSPSFSSDVYEYRVIVKENLNELVINAVPVVEGATVTIAGNTNLSEGENLITIVVYNVDGNVEATYQITVNKNTLDLSETDNLLRLGTETARRNLIIFIAILIIALIALIVVTILRHKNESNEEEYEEHEFTNSEENVENVEGIATEEQTDEEINQEDTPRPRREKRKGKHF